MGHGRALESQMALILLSQERMEPPGVRTPSHGGFPEQRRI